MGQSEIIEEIKRTWRYQRSLANDFLTCIPPEKWHFSHHKRFAPLSKQFRHMVWVYGVYIDAVKNRKMDLSKKKSFYSGPLEKEPIVEALAAKDKEFEAVLDSLETDDLESFQIDFFGQKMGLVEFSHVMVQHECAHMGLWANYAAFGDFETPKSWQDDWEL